MKRNMWMYLVVACFYILILAVGTIMLRMNFSNSDFSGGDLIYMFPASTWFYLTLLPIGLLVIWKLDKRLSVIIPFTFTILLLVAFELVQYPSIFFWDTFWHSATAKHIIDAGSFTANAGYYGYPGTFFISAILSEVLSLPVLLTNLIFAVLLNLSIVFLLLVIGRVFFGTEPARTEASWLIPTIFLVFSFRFYNGNHFSPQLLGLFLYIFLIYLCLKAFLLRTRAYGILLLVLVVALTTIHVFSAAVAAATLLCIYLLGGKIRPLELKNKQFVTLTILMTVIVVFISWHEFLTTEPLTEAVRFLSSVLRGERMLSGFAEAVVFRPLPGFFVPLLGVYRYSIYGLLGFTSAFALLLFWRKSEIKLLFCISVGILLGGVAIYFTPATFGVGRVLLYAGVVVSILTSYIVTANARAGFLALKRITEILKIVLPFLVIGTFLVSNFYYSTYISFVHQDETQVVQFVAANVRKQISVEVNDAYVMRFYANVSIPMLVITSRDNSTIAQMKIEKSSLSLQYLPRQLYYFDLSFVGNQTTNLIYSNGLGRVYAKADLDGGS